MGAIDYYMHKCSKCGNLTFHRREIYIISNDKETVNIREVEYACTECGSVEKREKV
jgi:predicted nucleic-acid-binding Zn-ribbon protein